MFMNSAQAFANSRRILTAGIGLLIALAFLLPDADAQIRAKKKREKRNRGGPVQTLTLDEVTIIRATGLDPSDIEPMAQKMMRDILSSPVFAQLQQQESGNSESKIVPIRIVLRPVKNYTSQRIDPEIITRRIENFLIRNSGGRLQFLARVLNNNEARIPNDVQIEQQLRASSVVDSPRGQKLASADYFMKGEIREHLTVTAQGRDRMLQFTFWLESTETLAKVWQDQYLIRRAAIKDKAYR